MHGELRVTCDVCFPACRRAAYIASGVALGVGTLAALYLWDRKGGDITGKVCVCVLVCVHIASSALVTMHLEPQKTTQPHCTYTPTGAQAAGPHQGGC